MLYFAEEKVEGVFSGEYLKKRMFAILEDAGPAENVLAVPPDITRCHSHAGELTRYVREYYGTRLKDILPAIGTHSAMTPEETGRMYGDIPQDLFRHHDWRNGTVSLGEVPADYVKKVSEGAVDYAWPAEAGRLLVEGGHDLILSIGQVVPHEVVGMANHNKNIFVGTGGPDGINKSHFLGAAYGMERIMGRADTPVRRVLDYASEHFAKDLPILYVLTVVGPDGRGGRGVRGLFAGTGTECFRRAADLSLRLNLQLLPEPVEKAVCYLDPAEFRSTWLGNKSVYRTRMAMADGGELIVLAPGLESFGEDAEIDRLIRKYGYSGTPAVLDAVENNADLKENLSAAAHLIHGSSEGRFKITLCPGRLSREEVESVNFAYDDLDKMIQRYNPEKLNEGFNVIDGNEKIFYISNPAAGLWAYEKNFR